MPEVLSHLFLPLLEFGEQIALDALGSGEYRLDDYNPVEQSY